MQYNKLYLETDYFVDQDGWVDIMYHGLDATGIDMQVSQSLSQDLYFSSESNY